MVPVGEHLVLIGQVRAAAVDQIDAGQMVFLGDLLGAQVFFDAHREIGAPLYRRVIANDHAVDAMHLPHARDHARTRGSAAIKPVCGQPTDLKERRSGIEQIRHPFSGQHLATAFMAGAGFLSASECRSLGGFAHGLQRVKMGGFVGFEAFG